MHHKRFVIAAVLAAIAAACSSSNVETTVAPLDGRDWRLAQLRGVAAVPAEEGMQQAMLRFEVDSGRVYGSSGCNRLTGPFTVAGDTLTFGALASTRMACADPKVNEQETGFLVALDSTRSYRISGDTLTLIGDSGPLILLVATPGG